MAEKLKIIPLGGIGEIGMNITAYEVSGEILLVDCGLSFPDEELYGVDIVVPDFTWMKKNKNRIRALVITHGHEDHIGAIPFFYRETGHNCPIFCTRLTAGLIEVKLEEANLLGKVEIRTLNAGQSFRCGAFGVEFIRVNHSIADAVSVAITTSFGVVIHTGDFKIDTTPVDGDIIDLGRFGTLGKKGVLALLSDSTNAERPGYTMSERKVGEALDNLFRNCENRIITTTFASNVHRLQQIINAAVRYGRKVAITGRSMENILRVSIQLEYIDIPPGTIVEVSQIKSLPKSKVCVITTGSQGEPMSALYRMAFGAHKQVEIGAGDRIIISASPIPGNEKTIAKMVNEMFKRGCEVIYEKLADIHVSGHACQEELKIILALTKPKYFMPIHGEYRMLKTHAALAKQCGIDPKNVFIPENGRALEITEGHAKLGGTVQVGSVYIDSDSLSEVGDLQLRDRKHLAEEGIIVVSLAVEGDCSAISAGPDIIARGYNLDKHSSSLAEEICAHAASVVENYIAEGMKDISAMRSALRSELTDFVRKKTRDNPVMLVTIVEG